MSPRQNLLAAEFPVTQDSASCYILLFLYIDSVPEINHTSLGVRMFILRYSKAPHHYDCNYIISGGPGVANKRSDWCERLVPHPKLMGFTHQIADSAHSCIFSATVFLLFVHLLGG